MTQHMIHTVDVPFNWALQALSIGSRASDIRTGPKQILQNWPGTPADDYIPAALICIHTTLLLLYFHGESDLDSSNDSNQWEYIDQGRWSLWVLFQAAGKLDTGQHALHQPPLHGQRPLPRQEKEPLLCIHCLHHEIIIAHYEFCTQLIRFQRDNPLPSWMRSSTKVSVTWWPLW